MSAMQVVQCQSCGGLYTPRQKDGTEYFHACPSRRVTGSTAAPTPDDPKATKPVFTVIDQPRNENIKALDATGKPVIVADGKGSLVVADPAVIAAFLNPVQEA